VPEWVIDLKMGNLLQFPPKKEEGFSRLFKFVDNNLIEI